MIEAKLLFANLVILSFIFVSASPLSRNEIAISSTHDHHGVSVSDDEVDGMCVYTLYIRTSSIPLGGTDSIISIKLSDETGSEISIDNLEKWGGLMGEGHNYYERGNLDIFTGRSPCLRRPVCAMRLESDGSNFSHSWFCNYVEVTVTGPDISCAQQLFRVDNWLSRDRGPNQLYATRNNCNTTSHFSRAHSMELEAQ